MSTAVASHSAGHSPLPPPRHHQGSSPPASQPLTPSRRTMPAAASQRQISSGSSPSEESRAAAAAAATAQPGSSSKRSPPPSSRAKQAPTSSGSAAPIPIIKKERQSSTDPQETPTERHRPRRLDLSNSNKADAGRPSAPLTSQRSAGLSAMQDVGLACLSPGFQTQDPQMQQQLQRSMDLREQQRQIIEARQRTKDSSAVPDSAGFARAPATSRRKGPPAPISIHAPSAAQFASEPRAIQSAPLHQSFTGLNRHASSHVHPLSRQVLDAHPEQRSHPSGTLTPSHPSAQFANRLPPISDVFREEALGSAQRPASTLGARNDANGYHPPPLQSPSFPPNPPSSAGLQPPSSHPLNGQSRTQPPSRQEASSIPPITSARHREFKSAEDAVQALSGGREDLQPKLVHYGGHQPPTPPSPLPPGRQANVSAVAARSLSGRRRTRDEYERDYAESGDRMEVDGRGEKRTYAPWDDREKHPEGAAPGSSSSYERGAQAEAGSWERGRQPPADERERTRWEHERRRDNAARQAHGPFGYGRDSPETQRRKKDEFLQLCARAWDLFHS